jgi:hypothetical protein
VHVWALVVPRGKLEVEVEVEAEHMQIHSLN